jgi:hypothetical protein
MAFLTPFLILVSNNTKKTGPIKKLSIIPDKMPFNKMYPKMERFTTKIAKEH